MARSDYHKLVIGRAELLHFVDLELADIPAKTDTGAYRNAVHASNIQLSDDGKSLSFTLLGGHPVCGKLASDVTTHAFKMVGVVNSFGHREDRYEVTFKVKLGPKVFASNFTLANRETMTYPILLGRKMLNNRFLVDPAHSGIDRKKLKKQCNVELPDDEEAKYK